MLTFEQKLAIIESFPQLQRKNVSLKRVNFHYEESVTDKKNVVYHLHPNGNGFVYGEYLDEYEIDERGMVNIRDFTEEELRTIVEKAIASLAPPSHEEQAIAGDEEVEHWIDDDGHTLILIYEHDMWNTYAGLNLDGSFLTYDEALEYLDEEGFKPKA
ncbi:hypothetical protein ACU3L3_01645 [Priestia endophytica]